MSAKVINHLRVYFETPGPLDPDTWDEVWDRLQDAIEAILCGEQEDPVNHVCDHPWTSGGHRHLAGSPCRDCDDE